MFNGCRADSREGKEGANVQSCCDRPVIEEEHHVLQFVFSSAAAVLVVPVKKLQSFLKFRI